MILVHVLENVTLEELLLNVSGTCKRLHSIINSNSRLWRYVSFDEQIILNAETVKYSVAFFRFLDIFAPVCKLKLFSSRHGLNFTQGLSAAKSLYWLDLSECELSSLRFLKYMPDLEILNVSGCKNLVDKDFVAVKYCNKFNQLYVSFTAISPSSVISLCSILKAKVQKG